MASHREDDLRDAAHLLKACSVTYAQYGGKSAYHSPSARNARQKARLAPSSSSASSMSGTYSASIDGVSRWISPGARLDLAGERELRAR